MPIRETSAKAYNEIKESGKLSEMEMLTYYGVCAHGPGTSLEIYKGLAAEGLMTSPRTQIGARLFALRDRDVVYEQGQRTCSVSGKTAIVWETTDRQPKPRRAHEAGVPRITPEVAASMADSLCSLLRTTPDVDPVLLHLESWLRAKAKRPPTCRLHEAKLVPTKPKNDIIGHNGVVVLL